VALGIKMDVRDTCREDSVEWYIVVMEALRLRAFLPED
jgi:hypothetical protein